MSFGDNLNESAKKKQQQQQHTKANLHYLRLGKVEKKCLLPCVLLGTFCDVSPLQNDKCFDKGAL